MFNAYGPVRAAGLSFLKRAPRIRLAFRGARRFAMSCYYATFRRRIDPKVVLFESFMGRSFAGSPRAIYEAMLADPRYAGHRFIWQFRDPDAARNLPQLADGRTTVVRYLTRDFYRACQQAGTWVGNSATPDWVTPRRGQTYVQTWHGTALKRLGLDVGDAFDTRLTGRDEVVRRYTIEGRKPTYFISGSPFMTKVFTSAFGLATRRTSPVRELGDPRNDRLVNPGANAREQARKELRIPAGKKVILYAPTWRDDQHDSRTGYAYTGDLDLAYLKDALGPEYFLLFRAHYFVTDKIDFSAFPDFARNVSGALDINDLYLAADVLVTDYSSAFFDFALLDRPMAFYCYDLDHYRADLRGFYLSLDDLPGPVSRTQEELVRSLLDPALGPDFAAARAAINQTYNPHADAHASRRVLDLLWEPDADR